MIFNCYSYAGVQRYTGLVLGAPSEEDPTAKLQVELYSSVEDSASLCWEEVVPMSIPAITPASANSKPSKDYVLLFIKASDWEPAKDLGDSSILLTMYPREGLLLLCPTQRTCLRNVHTPSVLLQCPSVDTPSISVVPDHVQQAAGLRLIQELGEAVAVDQKKLVTREFHGLPSPSDLLEFLQEPEADVPTRGPYKPRKARLRQQSKKDKPTKSDS